MKINGEVEQSIIKQAQAEAPEESCGYLLGHGDEVTENYPMENMDHSTEHFSFTPTQFAAVRYARKKVCAYWPIGTVILPVRPAHRLRTSVWPMTQLSVMPFFRCREEKSILILSR